MNDIDRRPHLYAEKRCRSTNNIASLSPPSPDDRAVAQRMLRGSKSASNSRTSLKSMKRRAPQPPGHHVSRSNSQKSNKGSRTELVYVPGRYVERPVMDDNDPDLSFDDPRARSNRNRDYTPTRTPVRSRANSASRGNRPSDLMVQNTDSPRAMRSRANTAERPSPLTQDNNLASSHPDKHQAKKKPGYFNPYAVKVPPKPASNPGRYARRQRNDHTDGIDIQPTASNYGFQRERRYSDNSSGGHSDHDLEDIDQVGILGDLDMGSVGGGGMDDNMNDDGMY